MVTGIPLVSPFLAENHNSGAVNLFLGKFSRDAQQYCRNFVVQECFYGFA